MVPAEYQYDQSESNMKHKTTYDVRNEEQLYESEH